MEESWIVGNPNLTITQKYDLIKQKYGNDYILTCSTILSVAGIGRRISSGGLALPGQEWSQRIKDLLVALFDEGLNPLPMDWMVGHVCIVGNYKRWLKKHPQEAPKAVVTKKKASRKTMAYYRAQFKIQAERWDSMPKETVPMILVGGYMKVKPPTKPKRSRKPESAPTPTLVMAEIVDFAKQWDAEQDPPGPIIPFPKSPGEIRAEFRRHLEAIKEECAQGYA